MEFLKLIPDKICCSPETVVLMPGPTLMCNACGKDLIGNVYQYINQPHPGDFFRSSELAQAFALVSGDENVPMSFPVVDIRGIHDTIVFGQSLSRVKRSIRLLRTLNAPFTTQPYKDFNADDMNVFMSDFLNIIHEHPEAKQSSEHMLLNALIQNMHTMLKSTKDNPLDMYYTQFVPFVQNCLTFKWTPENVNPEDSNLARELYYQLSMSYKIRAVFSRYSILFEAMHVMVCIYACCSDMNVVSNWGFDFLARACRGECNWMRYPQNVFVKTIQRLIHKEYSNTRNNNIVKEVINPIVRGESAEHWSHLWMPMHFMSEKIGSKLINTLKGYPKTVLLMAAYLYIPSVLFKDYADQAGFDIAFCHVLANCDKNRVPFKNDVFKEAKRIHILVREFVSKLCEFEKGKTPIIWDLNMVHLFLLSDEHLHDRIIRTVRTLLSEQDE